jgi:hypothetical protein
VPGRHHVLIRVGRVGLLAPLAGLALRRELTEDYGDVLDLADVG